MTTPVLQGQARTARVLAAARLRTMRTGTARFGAWVALAAVCLLVAMSGMVGDLLRVTARDQLTDLITVDQARAALAWVVQNPGGVILTASLVVLAACVFTAVAAPGPGRLIDAPPGHLVATGTLTRYLEHLATSLVSVVPTMQLVACIAAASVLTVDRQGRTAGVLTAVLAWLVAQALNQALLWRVTLTRRRASRSRTKATAYAVLAVLVVVLAAVTNAPRALADIVAGVPLALAAAALAVAGVALVALGMRWCELAGRLPALRSAGRRATSTPIPDSPWRAVLAVTATAAWRTSQVRSPLLTVMLAAAIGLPLFSNAPQALAGVAVSLPLAWSLSFTANFLALHGRGALWFGTLARTTKPLLLSGVVVGMVGCLVPGLLAMLPALALRTLDSSEVLRYVLLLLAVSALLTGASTLLAVCAPQPAMPGAGSSLLTPGRTLVSMLALAALSGLAWLAVESPATIVGTVGVESHWAFIGLGACLAVGGALVLLAWLMWPRLQARSMSIAGAA